MNSEKAPTPEIGLGKSLKEIVGFLTRQREEGRERAEKITDFEKRVEYMTLALSSKE